MFNGKFVPKFKKACYQSGCGKVFACYNGEREEGDRRRSCRECKETGEKCDMEGIAQIRRDSPCPHHAHLSMCRPSTRQGRGDLSRLNEQEASSPDKKGGRVMTELWFAFYAQATFQWMSIYLVFIRSKTTLKRVVFGLNNTLGK